MPASYRRRLYEHEGPFNLLWEEDDLIPMAEDSIGGVTATTLVHFSYCRACHARKYCWTRNVIVKGFVEGLIGEGMTDPGELAIMARTFVKTRYFRERMKRAKTRPLCITTLYR